MGQKQSFEAEYKQCKSDLNIANATLKNISVFPPATTPPATTPPATSLPATIPPATTPPATTPPATTQPATTQPATTPPATTPPAKSLPTTSPATSLPATTIFTNTQSTIIDKIYDGHLPAGYDVGPPTIENINSCKLLCNNNATCKSWMFNPSNGICHLKTGFNNEKNIIPSANWKTGFKLVEGFSINTDFGSYNKIWLIIIGILIYYMMKKQ